MSLAQHLLPPGFLFFSMDFPFHPYKNQGLPGAPGGQNLWCGNGQRPSLPRLQKGFFLRNFSPAMSKTWLCFASTPEKTRILPVQPPTYLSSRLMAKASPQEDAKDQQVKKHTEPQHFGRLIQPEVAGSVIYSKTASSCCLLLQNKIPHFF